MAWQQRKLARLVVSVRTARPLRIALAISRLSRELLEAEQLTPWDRLQLRKRLRRLGRALQAELVTHSE